MYQPATYAVTLAFMIVTMLCWGSWANTVKLCPGYRFQLFYWDYVIGLVVGVLFWGLTLGSVGLAGQRFLDALTQSSATSIGYAILGGVIFNVANLLLVAAIDIAGLAVAFPVGIGVALVVGAVASYLISPAGNRFLLFGGIAFVVAAILFDAAAYRLRDSHKLAMSKRGVIISVVSGLLMGSFYPFVAKSMGTPGSQGPYATALFFVIGVAACALPFNYLLMRKPLDGREPAAMSGYWNAKASWHLWGIIGGAIWSTGAVLNFVAARSQTVGPAISYSIGQGATMISACWGVFVWHEFSHAPPRAKVFLAVMFVFFLIGLTAVALAPIL
jgi:glucose uptake protein